MYKVTMLKEKDIYYEKTISVDAVRVLLQTVSVTIPPGCIDVDYPDDLWPRISNDHPKDHQCLCSAENVPRDDDIDSGSDGCIYHQSSGRIRRDLLRSHDGRRYPE